MSERKLTGKVLPFALYWVSDIALLFKLRLTTFVVFSAVMAYLVTAGSNFRWDVIALLFFGGMCITSPSNAINEVLEKDYDKLMKRTANRPVAAGRMTATTGLLIAGITWITGAILLWSINTYAAILGNIAVVLYAFIYTPLKRVSPFAVFVGAIPGAIPLLIGNVAAAGFIC